MNDRFKFRLWHKPLKTMHYNDFIVTATGYMAKIYQQDDYMMKFNQEDLEFDKQCILMQCTGLKDKNGKLIYEGDIVQLKNCSNILVIKHHQEMACFAPQFYAKDGYGGRVFFDDYTSYECGFYQSDNFIVIGNIYENKELLCQK